MNSATYHRKREELRARYPVYLSKKWLRNTRIIFTVFLLILVKVTQSTLPAYDIKCLHDNILDSFQGLQKYFDTPNTLFALEWTLFALVTVAVVAMAVHWVAFSDSLKLPLVVLIFYTVKLFSDTSLILDKPNSVKWAPVALFGIPLNYERIFFSNVCPFTGLILISLVYFTGIETRPARIGIVVLLALALAFAIFTQVLLQLVHSFALFSALIATGFAYIVSDDLLDYLLKRNGHVPVDTDAPQAGPPANDSNFDIRQLGHA